MWRSWRTLVLAHAPADRRSGDSDAHEDGCEDCHPNARSTIRERTSRPRRVTGRRTATGVAVAEG